MNERIDPGPSEKAAQLRSADSDFLPELKIFGLLDCPKADSRLRPLSGPKADCPDFGVKPLAADILLTTHFPTFRKPSRNRTYIITTSRITSGDELKRLKGLAGSALDLRLISRR